MDKKNPMPKLYVLGTNRAENPGEKILSLGQWLLSEEKPPNTTHTWVTPVQMHLTCWVTDHGNRAPAVTDTLTPSRRERLMGPWPNKESCPPQSSPPLDSSDGVFKSEVERRLQTRGFQLKPSSFGFANYLMFWNVPYIARHKYSDLQLGSFFPNCFIRFKYKFSVKNPLSLTLNRSWPTNGKEEKGVNYMTCLFLFIKNFFPVSDSYGNMVSIFSLNCGSRDVANTYFSLSKFHLIWGL